jgi:hypothetical protein
MTIQCKGKHIMSEQKNNLRSIEELDARYARFCLNNDLDGDLSPEEQTEEFSVIENARLSMWLERHNAEREIAEQERSLVATGEKASLVENIHLDCKAIANGEQRVTAAISVNRNKSSSEKIDIFMAAIAQIASDIDDERISDPVEIKKSPTRNMVKRAVKAVASVKEASSVNPPAAACESAPVSQEPKQMGLFA